MPALELFIKISNFLWNGKSIGIPANTVTLIYKNNNCCWRRKNPNTLETVFLLLDWFVFLFFTFCNSLAIFAEAVVAEDDVVPIFSHEGRKSCGCWGDYSTKYNLTQTLLFLSEVMAWVLVMHTTTTKKSRVWSIVSFFERGGIWLTTPNWGFIAQYFTKFFMTYWSIRIGLSVFLNVSKEKDVQVHGLTSISKHKVFWSRSASFI